MITALWVILALQVQLTPISFDPLASPTPRATATMIPVSTLESLDNAYDYMATAEKNLLDAPDSLAQPGGAPLLPNTSETGEVFGYAKWLISPATGAELFGPLSPLTSHIANVITLALLLASVFLLVMLVSLIMRFVVWLIRLVRTMLPF